jgi:hypothetical protein
MTLHVFKDEVSRQILLERERAAKIAEKHGCPEAAIEIRAARRPSFRIVKPMTVEKYPDLLKREDLVVSNLTARDVRNGAQMVHYDPMRGVEPVDTPGVTFVEA